MADGKSPEPAGTAAISFRAGPMNLLRISSLRRAIVLAVVIGLLIPALVIGGVSWLQRYNVDIRTGTITLLRQNAEILSHGMQEPLWNVNQESAAALLDVMLRNEDVISVEVRDNVLGIFVAGEHPERRVGFTATTTQPVSYQGTLIGSVRLEVGSARLQKILAADMQHSFLALAAQVFLSVLLILVLLETRLVRPLQRLGSGAERLARGQLDVPFNWVRLDEIGLFSQRLEKTRVSLRNLFDELGRKNHELERDIEMRKHIEHELHERETRFRVLVEHSPIAIIEWDLNFRVIEWNAAAEQIFGYARRKALGQHAGFIIPNRSAEQVNGIFRKLMAGAGADRSVSQNIRADGQIIICQWRNAHIADQPGHVGRLLSMAEDITEKRRAEEAQTLSEAKFAGAFQCNPDSVSIARLSDGLMIDVNQTFEKITGYSRREAVGKTSVELGIWAVLEQRTALIGLLRTEGTVRDFSWQLCTRQGQIRTCLINATLFSVSNDTYLLAVIRDVTDQRMMEAQKAEVDRALMRLAEGSQQYAGAAFFESLVTDISSALRADIAYIGLRSTGDPDRIDTLAIQINGKTVGSRTFRVTDSPCEHVLRGDIALFPAGLKSMFRNDQALQEMNYDSYAGAPIHNAAGQAIGVLAVANAEPLRNPDLVKTLLRVFSERASAELERVQAETALRNSEQRFAAMFHASPISMVLSYFGDDFALLDVNQAFERMHRRPRSSVIGKNASLLGMYLDYEDRNSIVKVLERTGRVDRFQTWMRLGDGTEALIQLSGNIFESAGQRLLIMASEDVTEIHEIEKQILASNSTLEERVTQRTDALHQANQDLASTLERLNMAQEELVRSGKLAALGALVAGIAHELNTPIGNSLMIASTLADRTNEFVQSSSAGLKRSALDAYLQDAAKAGEILVRNLYRAADLVTSFKQVAIDQTSSQRRRFLLAEVVGEIVLTLSPSIRKTAIKVQQSIPGRMALDSFPGPLGQVLTNLVNNALLHGFEGRDEGTIVIAATEQEQGWIELTVSDDGVGIQAGNLERIFDPFFTTKLGAGGSGLGLNITHNIVSGVLGGRIRVKSKVGTGTTFHLDLPLSAPHLVADTVQKPAVTLA